MPGWSPQIANEFIRLAANDGKHLDQLQLQALVYIAHGWTLAFHEQPLTGDRPEAWEFGPMYRRLSDALVEYGSGRVTREIDLVKALGTDSLGGEGLVCSGLDQFETDLIAEIYQNYAGFESWQLSALTRDGLAPWKQVYAGGVGKARDISHQLIGIQFVELLRQSENWKGE